MKILKRVFRGILVFIAIFIVFLIVSVTIDAAIGRGRIDRIANTIIPGINGTPSVHAYVAKPPGQGPFPTVIMIHEFLGLQESVVSRADLLAEAGYLVIAPDTFRGSVTSWIPRAIYLVSTTRPENVKADLDSVYAWLEAQPDVDANRIAIAGFCYGGRTSLVYSLQNNKLAATVIFYGALETDPTVLRALPGPVLGIFGGADRSIPVEQINAFDQALTNAGVPHEITIYDGQPHAFVRDAEGIKAGGAQGEAWNQMLAFLDRNLRDTSVRNNNFVSLNYPLPFAWKYYVLLAYEHAFGITSHQH